jgi:hypothetical protein
VWAEDKINSLQAKLDNIRSELILRLSKINREQLDLIALTQDDAFKTLDERTAAIALRLAEVPVEIASALSAPLASLRDRHDQSDTLAIQLHHQTLSAIAQLQPVSSYTNLQPMAPSPGLLYRQSAPASIDKIQRGMIKMLRFRQMATRQDDVATAHPDTFKWILEDPTPSMRNAAFSPLMPWLNYGEGAYWVNGKAGSGKSTLMKFLGASQAVRQVLQEWAHPHELILASFYFWRSGTALQKSQEGLLRWLLYIILSKKLELVQTCFPEEFDKLKSGEVDISEVSPGLEMLSTAFALLSRTHLNNIKIFLFVDGVDEFEGDHTYIATLFRNLAATSSFKILLSSRTTPACVEAFTDLPGLCLQDLTHKDIEAYVYATVMKHERMDFLLSQNKEEAAALTSIIISKADGVFLWVRLVVRSLLDGFRNYDRISDLKERVNESPAELGDLYMHMFQSMESRYQAHGAQLLRIVVRSIEMQEDHPLTVQKLFFADENTLQEALSAPINILDEKEQDARCEAMTGRIRSRCCGLIEVRNSQVNVIHKSVLDFLAEEKVWSLVLSMTHGFVQTTC